MFLIILLIVRNRGGGNACFYRRASVLCHRKTKFYPRQRIATSDVGCAVHTDCTHGLWKHCHCSIHYPVIVVRTDSPMPLLDFTLLVILLQLINYAKVSTCKTLPTPPTSGLNSYHYLSVIVRLIRSLTTGDVRAKGAHLSGFICVENDPTVTNKTGRLSARFIPVEYFAD